MRLYKCIAVVRVDPAWVIRLEIPDVKAEYVTVITMEEPHFIEGEMYEVDFTLHVEELAR